MAAWTKEAGLPAPEILEIPGAVLVRFKSSVVGVTGTTGKTPLAVLALLAEDPTLTAPQLAARLGKSELTVHRALRTLRESGRLQRIGPDKGGYWRLID